MVRVNNKIDELDQIIHTKKENGESVKQLEELQNLLLREFRGRVNELD